MISIPEKEMIIAYFTGGNAEGKQADQISLDMAAIKEAARDSKIDPEDHMVKVFNPSKRNPAV